MRSVRSWWLCLAVLLVACGPSDRNGASSSSDTSAPPVRLTSPIQQRSDPTFVLRDTVPWANALYGGARAVLLVDGAVVDTVEVTSVQRVPGGFIYQPVRATDIVDIECDGTCSDLHGWTMYIGYPVQLSDMLPALDPMFSSPSVIDSVMYWWGLEGPDSEGVYRMSARSYDFRDRALGALELYSGVLETDNVGHFRPAYVEDGGIVFETYGRRFVVEGDLSQMR